MEENADKKRISSQNRRKEELKQIVQKHKEEKSTMQTQLKESMMRKVKT